LRFNSKQDVRDDFEEIWDARDGAVERSLSASKVSEGSTVVVGYTVVPYGSTSASKEREGYGAGSTLTLLSVGLLVSSDDKYEFESPRKRRKISK